MAGKRNDDRVDYTWNFMNESMDDVTTGDYNIAIGHKDGTTIIHPERKSEDAAETADGTDSSRAREDDESSMSWKFVLGMIFLALILSINL